MGTLWFDMDVVDSIEVYDGESAGKSTKALQINFINGCTIYVDRAFVVSLVEASGTNAPQPYPLMLTIEPS